MCCKAGTVLNILWPAKHFSILVGNNCLICVEYTDFHISINLFTANPECRQVCVGYIFARSASLLHRKKVTTNPMHPNMKDNIFHITSSIILPRLLNLRYPVQPETLAVSYWNLWGGDHFSWPCGGISSILTVYKIDWNTVGDQDHKLCKFRC